jgi:hypothetical protein
MEGSASNLLDDPAVGAIVCNFRDIMERKQPHVCEQEAHTEAEAAQTLMHDLFMQAPVLIAILHGPEHRFDFANPLVLRTRRCGNLLGKTIQEALPELAEHSLLTRLDEVYATGVPFIGTEVLVQIDRRGARALPQC